MCKRDHQTLVNVKIPADLSCDGKEKWKRAKIDTCIAPLIKALQEGGIDMRGSCCGHNKKHGWIELQDGRSLLILDRKYADYYWHSPISLYIRSVWRHIFYAIRNHMDYVWRS